MGGLLRGTRKGKLGAATRRRGDLGVGSGRCGVQSGRPTETMVYTRVHSTRCVGAGLSVRRLLVLLALLARGAAGHD